MNLYAPKVPVLNLALMETIAIIVLSGITVIIEDRGIQDRKVLAMVSRVVLARKVRDLVNQVREEIADLTVDQIRDRAEIILTIIIKAEIALLGRP